MSDWQKLLCAVGFGLSVLLIVGYLANGMFGEAMCAVGIAVPLAALQSDDDAATS